MSDGALGRPAADLVARLPEGPIAHTLPVGGEVASQILNRLALGRAALVRTQEPEGSDHFLHPVLPEPVQLFQTPLLAAFSPLAVENACRLAHVFLGVIPVQDLHPPRELLGRQIPDPRRAISPTTTSRRSSIPAAWARGHS